MAIVGDADAVGEQLQHLTAIGVTEFVATPFAVAKDAAVQERTRAVLLKFAQAGVRIPG